MAINTVQSREIEELSAEQLTRLLQMLLCLEVEKRDLQGFYYVSQKITTADGGEDGRITVNDPRASSWITNKTTLLQCKATNLIPSKIGAEFLEKDPVTKAKSLKPVIKQVLDNGGDYNLFMSKDASTHSGIENRINKMVEACKSVGLTYNRSQFKVYDANKIAEWATEYMATVTYVLECNNRTRPDIFRTWQQWGRDYQTSLSFKFEDAALTKKMAEIKTMLKTESAVRIIGHSGIGKTRLVYETFKHDPSHSDLAQNTLNASVVYYDYGLVQNSDLPRYILNFKENTVGVIIVDNCPNDVHQALAGLVRSNSKLKIISIDFSLETEEKNLIKLSKADQKETVKLMLRALYPVYGDTEIQRLADLAEGYPKMVELLQEAIAKSGPNAINTQLPGKFIEKLVFGRKDRNDAEYNIIKSCAIFSEFNFIDEEIEEVIGDQQRLDQYKVHRDFIAAEVCDPSISDALFYRTCRMFKKDRNILERRGYTLTVVPTPLAANLAAEWILDYPPDKFQEFCTRLIGAGLIDAFCKRLRSLDQVESAKSLVAKLWGPQGPFASAEVLNTELGSRLFRSVVEVNPEATVSALTLHYADNTIDQTKAIDKGRRNLIWSLEKLLFRKETFDDSILILARFAAAETENISNNATGQFLQTFHIFLPGTEANLKQRLSVIDQLLEEQEPEYTDLALSAISASLKSHNFSRMGGANAQGSSTMLVDYMPQTWQEIYDYWEAALQRLLAIVQQKPEMITRAKEILSLRIRSIFGQNRGQLLLPIINYLMLSDPSLWEGAIKALRMSLKYEQLDEANRALANQLIASLTPTDWRNKIKFVVSVPEWDYDDRDMLRAHEKATAKLRDLLYELNAMDVPAVEFLPQVLTGEQRRGVLFGRVMAEDSARQHETGTLIIKMLGDIEKSERSSDVLAGLLSAAQTPVKDQLIRDIAQDKRLSYLLFTLLRFGRTSASDIEVLFPLVDENIADITQFTNILFYVGEGGLTVQQVTDLCTRIEAYGEKGKWTAFSIYNQLTYSDEVMWQQFKDQMRRLIIQTNFINMEVRHFSADLFIVVHAAQRIFKEGIDEALAIALSAQIAESLQADFPSGNFHLQDLVQTLMSGYFDIIFDKLGPALLSNSIVYWNVKDLLGSKNGSDGHSGLLFLGDTSKIVEWCERHQPKGPERIAYIMPVFNTEPNGSLWHPFAKIMIDRFYNVPGLLNEIGANMGSFGWFGSAVPYYEKLSAMMKELFDHSSIKVRKWAKTSHNYYQKQIKLEILNDEQDEIS
jgi:hypothetical protein